MEKNPWLNCCSVFGRCTTSEMQLQTPNLKLHYIKKIQRDLSDADRLTQHCAKLFGKDLHKPDAYLHIYNSTLQI